MAGTPGPRALVELASLRARGWPQVLVDASPRDVVIRDVRWW